MKNADWKAEAQQAAIDGDMAKAEAILVDAKAAEPDNTEPSTMLCQLHINAGAYGSALAALEPVLGNLNATDAYLLASRLMVQENRARDAVETCGKGIALQPDHLDSLIHLAQIYMALRQKEALEKLCIHAETYLKDEALEAFDEAVEAGTGVPDAG